MDVALIANECLVTMKKSSCSGIICKLDIEKALDHVNWGFLINMLKEMGDSQSSSMARQKAFFHHKEASDDRSDM